MNLVDRLEQYRAEERTLAWRGTFKDYFEIVVAHPEVARLSHARVFDMIEAAGCETLPNGDRRYQFFADQLFGIEKPLQQLVDYFASAASRLEVRKRILLLMGPVGGGKSSIVTILKRGLEQATRGEDGAVYAIAGCPMHEEPLHLLPDALRPEIERDHGIYVEGDLCPACRVMLAETYNGRIEDVPVQRVVFSEKHRIGIGTFAPSDPKSQDISELTGSIDLSTIGNYGSESDPRAYRFDGELNIANRGLMEFVEMLKCQSGDALILTDAGIKRLDDLADPGHPVEQSRPKTLRVATSVGQEPATHLYLAGRKPTLRLTTRRGYVQEGTREHRVLVVDEQGSQVWRRHDELRLGDWLVLQKGHQLWGEDVVVHPSSQRDARARPARLPHRVTPDLARWLGYMCAEGDTQANGLIRFTSQNQEMVDDFVDLSIRLFGSRPVAHTKGVRFSSIRVLDFIEHLGWRTGAADKEIPWAVLQSSRDSVVEFLAGYFAGDGSVGLNGRLWWATASSTLARQLQFVLLNLGVVSRRTSLVRSVAGESRTYWQVMADGANADLLARHMRLLPSYKQAMYAARAAAQPRVGRADTIPNTSRYWRQISDELQSAMINAARVAVGGPGYRARTGAHQLLGSDYLSLHAFRSGTQQATRDKSQAILDKIAAWVEPPVGLSSLLNPSQFYDQVVAIEPSEAECWDLHVPGSNTYVANGLVNHNCDEKFLYHLLTLSQEQNIKTSRFAMIYADEVIVSHTNENEYQHFINNKRSEALHDRIILIKVPYNLCVREEIKIYEKLLKQSSLVGVHIAP